MKPILSIPLTILLIYRAWYRKSLTTLGLLAAAITAIVHAIHPWSTPFTLLGVFYLAGTKVTKVKHAVKASLTLSATGSEGGEEQRTHNQVLANSIVASVLILAHSYILRDRPEDERCFSFGKNPADILAVGIVANYAAVTADTFSSELGILSSSPPRLITSPSFRVVPRGTNGGVTLTGLLAGAGGAFLIATLSGIMLPGCSSLESSGSLGERAQWILAMTIWGGIGSVVDSVLGGLVQASVVDKRSGKVVEGSGGKKVLLHPSSTKPTTTDNPATSTASLNTSSQLRNTEAIANTATLRGSRVTGTSEGTQPGRPHDDKHESRRVESGRDWLDNNAVNLLMASIMSFGAMGIASLVWG